MTFVIIALAWLMLALLLGWFIGAVIELRDKRG